MSTTDLATQQTQSTLAGNSVFVSVLTNEIYPKIKSYLTLEQFMDALKITESQANGAKQKSPVVNPKVPSYLSKETSEKKTESSSSTEVKKRAPRRKNAPKCAHVSTKGKTPGTRCKNNALEGSDYCRTHQGDADPKENKSVAKGKKVEKEVEELPQDITEEYIDACPLDDKNIYHRESHWNFLIEKSDEVLNVKGVFVGEDNLRPLNNEEKIFCDKTGMVVADKISEAEIKKIMSKITYE